MSGENATPPITHRHGPHIEVTASSGLYTADEGPANERPITTSARSLRPARVGGLRADEANRRPYDRAGDTADDADGPGTPTVS